jgi:hypothetical protein
MHNDIPTERLHAFDGGLGDDPAGTAYLQANGNCYPSGESDSRRMPTVTATRLFELVGPLGLEPRTDGL